MAQIVLGCAVALIGGPEVPVHGLFQVNLYPQTVFILIGQVVLTGGVALLGGPVIPIDSFPI